MFQLDPKSLTDSRVQLHWAAQLLAAAADSMLERSPDDSHSNLAWDEANRSMEGRIGARIEFPTMNLVTASGDTFSLLGNTLEQARIWLDEEVETELVLRDYDMPAHTVAEGAVFDVPQADRDELAAWFTFGQQAMGPIAGCRIWPHHFDLGWLIEIEGPNKSIGGGMSPGDGNFDQPYFYVNPYGVENPGELPSLTDGASWADGWFGAVMTAEQILASNDPATITKSFLNDTVSMMRSWF